MIHHEFGDVMKKAVGSALSSANHRLFHRLHRCRGLWHLSERFSLRPGFLEALPRLLQGMGRMAVRRSTGLTKLLLKPQDPPHAGP